MVVLKHLLCQNYDIKLILMSATIDAQLFANYFSESSINSVFDT
jgi:HrpA-like RNA helicase